MELQQLPPVVILANCKRAFSPPNPIVTVSKISGMCNGTTLLKLSNRRRNEKKGEPLSSSLYSCCSFSSNSKFSHRNNTTATTTGLLLSGLVAAALLLFSPTLPVSANDDTDATLSNVPQTLSQDDKGKAGSRRIQRPKSKKAESCVGKCVSTCIRGDQGEGPLNIRRSIVVFKPGFRSRQYCLLECSDICNLIRDGEDGP